MLPRHWDGRRLLRFLTGLAMIALAFTVHVTPLAPAAAHPVGQSVTQPAAHSAAEPAGQSVTVSAVSQVPARATTVAPSATLPLLRPVAPAGTVRSALAGAVFLLLVAGYLLRVRAERAPPLA